VEDGAGGSCAAFNFEPAAWLCAAGACPYCDGANSGIHFPFQIFRSPARYAEMEILNPLKT
jgi:hypothetical protein